MSDPRSIGIFDSGVGGLTVVRAVLDLVPGEPVLYFGDTARAPYGPRAVDEIRAFAREVAAYLLGRDVKMLVVACNAIESNAIEDLSERANVPLVGVIEPGVRAALRTTRNGRVGVIGTEATIASGAYPRAVAAEDGGVELVSAACPAFVPHVERGDTTSPELLSAARGYLAPLRDAGVDTLILGCTHYPLLSGLLQRVMGPEVVPGAGGEVPGARGRPRPRPECPAGPCAGALMEVTVLGTSAAWPGPGRAASGFLVQHEGTALALDLGPGTLSNLQLRVPHERLDAVLI